MLIMWGQKLSCGHLHTPMEGSPVRYPCFLICFLMFSCIFLMYPHGRCLSFSPPKESLNSSRINSLVIILNETTIEKLNFKSFKLWVYFMDRSNSLQIYPDEMEMLGDPVRIDMFCEKPPFITFKTQISRSVHSGFESFLTVFKISF